ncbi:ClpX C4-type zinc finger protein [Sphaerisporangium rufum]|uniref:ClpX C4-type zinc finger protein n=1 Tax=Sphaerisporangium rufum TaxID=1381558 RepID=UPI001951E11E|nr:ClpX C4-type zinc finger protein [Sphaerisporangium rufum]
MPAPSLADQEIYCSFCTKPKTDVAEMIAGAGVHICDECVGCAAASLTSRHSPRPARRSPGRTP